MRTDWSKKSFIKEWEVSCIATYGRKCQRLSLIQPGLRTAARPDRERLSHWDISSSLSTNRSDKRDHLELEGRMLPETLQMVRLTGVSPHLPGTDWLTDWLLSLSLSLSLQPPGRPPPPTFQHFQPGDSTPFHRSAQRTRAVNEDRLGDHIGHAANKYVQARKSKGWRRWQHKYVMLQCYMLQCTVLLWAVTPQIHFIP